MTQGVKYLLAVGSRHDGQCFRGNAIPERQ